MRTILLALAALALGCSSSSSPVQQGGPPDGGGSSPDSGSPPDGGGPPPVDAAGTDGASGGDTWANYAQGFFATYCTSCHESNSSLEPTMPSNLYFTTQANVETQKDVIRCGVCVTQDPSWSCPSSGPTAKQFPIGSGAKPSDTERNRIVAWITAGAP